MSTKIASFFLVVVSSAAAACSAYQPAPVNLNHPAHPSGAAAIAPARSMTLANSVAAIGATGAQIDTRSPAAAEPVSAEGKVVAVVPSASQLVVEHGEIKGFMEAMTMGYRVEPSSLLDGLKFGDRVRFTIDVAKKAIVKIEKVK